MHMDGNSTGSIAFSNLRRYTLTEKRNGKDRRVNKDRRKGGASSYRGPEKRAIRDRRTDSDRREKD